MKHSNFINATNGVSQVSATKYVPVFAPATVNAEQLLHNACYSFSNSFTIPSTAGASGIAVYI